MPYRRPSALRRRVVMFVTATACLATAGAPAAFGSDPPRTPRRDEVVETQLLAPAIKRSVRELAAAHQGAAITTDRIDTARRLIESARASGDPRSLGYAEQLLAPLSDTTAKLTLQATIEQSRHRFERARSLLDRALLLDPRDPQALLTRATVARLIGDLRSAVDDCRRIEPRDPDVASVCVAEIDALRGRNDAARALLTKIVAHGAPERRAWALSIAGDVERQDGDAGAAIRSYVASLALSEDLYTRVALADTLISEKRAQAAFAVLARAPSTDAVLLQRWRALRSLQSAHPDLAAIETELMDRIALATERQDDLHVREAARFALERGDAVKALRLARHNWSIQREPADLLLLIQAGHATQDTAAVADARAWIRATGLSDRRVDAALRSPLQ